MDKTVEQQRLFSITAYERSYWQRGVRVGGMDEVGRGPLAGPVVAACVIMPQKPLIENVRDSKKLTEKSREKLYDKIIDIAEDHYIAAVPPDIIDEINILNATKKAFSMAYEGIRLPCSDVLVDALSGLDISANQQAIIKGDDLSYSIAAASIIAKVTRDRLMQIYHELYPQYGFDNNKGYGTKQHIEALKEYGPCKIHRRSFIKGILYGE